MMRRRYDFVLMNFLLGLSIKEVKETEKEERERERARNNGMKELFSLK